MKGRKNDRKKMKNQNFQVHNFFNFIKVSGTIMIKFAYRIYNGKQSVSFLHSSACFFSFGNCSYTLCTGGQFKCACSLNKKYYTGRKNDKERW